MPVRNGQKYIREAIDSIVAQTFADWELIVCDNASTDATEQIVREYAARDARVRYHRNPTDIGPAANYNMGVHLSRGEYFRWHAHDDMIAPTYLEECVKAQAKKIEHIENQRQDNGHEPEGKMKRKIGSYVPGKAQRHHCG